MAEQKIEDLTALTTPDDADNLVVDDTSASTTKITTWANIKATLKTYFDTLYALAVHTHTASSVTDFDTEVANNSAVTANTAKNTYPSADATKLAGIEVGATADQTGAEIKSLYEAESDTNAYTDAEKTKLAGVEASATADQSDAEIETAYNNQVAQVSAGEKTAGTETAVRRFSPDDVKDMIDTHASAAATDGDAIHDNVAGEINALTEKASPVSADIIIIEDSADSNNKKKVQVGNLPGGTGTDSDAIHDNVAGEISAITAKTTPVDADVAVIEDSADSSNKKSLSWANIKATLKTYFDTLYESVSGLTFTENTDGFEIAGGSTSERTLTVSGGDVTITAGTPTKGDILVGDGTDLSAVSVGSDDQILVADSSQSRGVKYADNHVTLNFVIDGGGSAITTGEKGAVQIDFAGEIEQVTLLADQSGSIVVDIWKDSYANYPATDADSITASAVPTISSATKAQDATLTGWTTSITAGDHLIFNVDSITTCERVTVALKIKKTY